MNAKQLEKALTTYAKNIVSGKRIACKKHVWACKRFLVDLENQNTESFPYEFNPEKALHFIKWSRFFKHSKGKLTGKYIELDILQKFITSNIYGWYHTETGHRRFNKMYYQVARKNAKSQLLSLIATYELMVFLDGEISEVYCAATNKDQAKIVYDEALIMLERCPELKDKWDDAYKKITHLKSKSILRPLSKEDRKSGDGLNPQCGIIDEYHAHETSEIYDVIESGMGARLEPIIVIITTAGFNLNNPCYRLEYKLASDILNPDNPINLHNIFAMICELETNTSSETIEIDGKKIAPGELIDDIEDETNWIKANPIVCSYPEGVKYIREKLEEAKAAPEKKRNLLTKHFNVWVNERDGGYMNLEKWSSCGINIEKFPDTRNKPVFIGLDLSKKLDMTSAAFVLPDIDGKYAVFSHSFIPEANFHTRIKTDKMPFDLWEKQGFITVTKGAAVNYRKVVDYCIEQIELNDWYCECFCIDPWGSLQISNDLIELGYEVIDITQGPKTLSEPTKNFREEVYEKNVIHDNNPVLSWSFGNAVAENVDRNENIMLSKKKSTERIDAAAAVINAWVRAMINEDSGYNTQGMRGFDV